MVLICTMLSAVVCSIECFGLWVSGLVLSLDVLVESGDGFRATLVTNNREGTEEKTRDIVDGCEGIASGLVHDNATCLSGAV